MNQNIIEITIENFQQVIIEESKNKLVLVDFWAEQIPESIELKDILAKKLVGFEEHVLYATVDCQSQQQIAAQFGIQGLPTAILVKDSQPLDGLSGPQSAESIDEFLNKHLPKPQDELLIKAKDSLASDAKQAYSFASQAYELDNERADIKLTLADACVAIGKIEEGQTLIDSIKMIDQDSYYQSIVAKLEFASEAANSPEIQALEKTLANDPKNVDIIHQLAAQYSQVNRHEDALALLFRQVQSVKDDAESKKILLDILKLLPEGDSLATKYRRKLYTLMY